MTPTPSQRFNSFNYKSSFKQFTYIRNPAGAFLQFVLLNVLKYQFTAEWPGLLSHYTTSAFLASEPVVDVTFDQSLVTNGAPQSKVHCFIVGLAEWNCCRYPSVSTAGCPGGTRGDCVWTIVKICVIREGPAKVELHKLRRIIGIALFVDAM